MAAKEAYEKKALEETKANKKVEFELLRKKVLNNKNFIEKDNKCIFCGTFNFDKWYYHRNTYYNGTIKSCPVKEILATEDNMKSEWLNLIVSINPYITDIPYYTDSKNLFDNFFDDVKLSLFKRI